ncbi:MAG TPA: translation elongation factor Ts [Acidobacteriota bacterium]
MAISAEQVKQLRDKTGAGFMECKAALQEASGSVDQAITILRKKGLATAAKKAGRAAKDGVVAAYVSEDHRTGVLVEVNCETDFVAKTDQFRDLVQRVAAHISSHKPGKIRSEDPGEGPALYDQAVEGGSGNWGQFVAGRIATIGENILVRRFVHYQGEFCEAYIHGGGKVGVLVELSAQGNEAALKEVGKDLAMHIAASDPRYISKDQVTQEDLAREREIYREQALKEGKPANVVDKIVEGKLSKFYSDVCLYEQPFIKDTGLSVGKWIASRTGGKGQVTVKRFTRYLRGEL